MITEIKNKLAQLIASRLDRYSDNYFYRIPNNLESLKRHIRKGDVILVEGKKRISEFIKLFSQSHWSHSAFYVGDELIRTDNPHKEKLLDRFGDRAEHLIVEALATKGVVVNPIDNYEFHNIRICRPFGIKQEDLQDVIDHVIGNIGKKYDQRNIYHLALSLIPFGLNPWKDKSIEICIGNCDEFEVICSGMIAKAFQRVGYPISPAIRFGENNNETFSQENPYGKNYKKRHYSQIIPADFDLSPNFGIIKFNIIEDGKFDYRSLSLTEN